MLRDEQPCDVPQQYHDLVVKNVLVELVPIVQQSRQDLRDDIAQQTEQIQRLFLGAQAQSGIEGTQTPS